MSQNVTVALTYTAVDFSAGSNPEASLDCRLKQGTSIVQLKSLPAPFPPSVSFASVPPGDYTFVAQALDALSNPVGNPYSLTLTVAAPPPVVNQIVTGASASFS